MGKMHLKTIKLPHGSPEWYAKYIASMAAIHAAKYNEKK